MATKTLRPLKKGDPCWIRVKGKNIPVLAVYSGRFGGDNSKIHEVFVGSHLYHAVSRTRMAYGARQHWVIFVAKPIPEDA